MEKNNAPVYVIAEYVREKRAVYLLHSDNQLHNNVCDRRGCRLVTYKSEKTAATKARQTAARFTYGPCRQMTLTDYYAINELPSYNHWMRNSTREMAEKAYKQLSEEMAQGIRKGFETQDHAELELLKLLMA